MNNLVKAAAAYAIYKRGQAVGKESIKGEIIDESFYVSIPSKREWKILIAGTSDQQTQVEILKMKSYIKNFGGEVIKTLASDTDTRIYFKMPRTSFNAFAMQTNATNSTVTFGEVKEI